MVVTYTGIGTDEMNKLSNYMLELVWMKYVLTKEGHDMLVAYRCQMTAASGSSGVFSEPGARRFQEGV